MKRRTLNFDTVKDEIDFENVQRKYGSMIPLLEQE